jgi:hypothetical protein
MVPNRTSEWLLPACDACCTVVNRWSVKREALSGHDVALLECYRRHRAASDCVLQRRTYVKVQHSAWFALYRCSRDAIYRGEPDDVYAARRLV